MTFAEDLERVEAVVVDTPRGKRALVIAREAQKWLDARKADRKETHGRQPAKPSQQCPILPPLPGRDESGFEEEE